jgi:hypothetical protein
MTSLWFFSKTAYYLFYSMSYTIESELNKWIKVANMTVIFIFSIFLTYSLFDHMDSKQYELGYLTIFIIFTLLVLNIIVTLNPISREQGVDLHQRSCCSSQNLMATMSFLFCFNILELHNIFVATPEQKRTFYGPFHHIIGIWLVGLWVHVQKIPERCVPDSKFVHKFCSSDVLKSIVVVTTVIVVQLLLRDTMKLAENHRAVTTGVPPLPSAPAPVPHFEAPKETHII